MENKKRIFIVLFVSLFFFVSLIISKPSNTSFENWIADEYQIECNGQECLLNSNKFQIVDRQYQNYLFFNKKSLKLERRDGTYLFVEGVGILGTFTLQTYKPLY